MKNLYSIIICLSSFALAHEAPFFKVLECGELAVFGRTMSDGSYIEEVVPADHPGRELVQASYAGEVFNDKPASGESIYARELYVSANVNESGYEVRVGLDLLAWRDNVRLNRQLHREYMSQVAQNGEGVPDVEPAQAPPQPGILRRSANFVVQQYQEHPIRSTLVTVASILLVDYWEGGGIDMFGLLGSSGGGSNEAASGNVIVTSSTRGDGSPVNITIISGDGSTGNGSQTSTRTDSTSQPFFPPQ